MLPAGAALRHSARSAGAKRRNSSSSRLTIASTVPGVDYRHVQSSELVSWRYNLAVFFIPYIRGAGAIDTSSGLPSRRRRHPRAFGAEIHSLWGVLHPAREASRKAYFTLHAGPRASRKQGIGTSGPRAPFSGAPAAAWARRLAREPGPARPCSGPERSAAR